jgi:hypothetical protein
MDSLAEIQMLRQVLMIVREYPDFDEGGVIPDMINEALQGKMPELLKSLDQFLR